MARRGDRASMREGPLADLFRSTEESVAPDEVKVTATSERRYPSWSTEPQCKRTFWTKPCDQRFSCLPRNSMSWGSIG